MPRPFQNELIIRRFDELIAEGEEQSALIREHPTQIRDAARLSEWTSSALNLLDKLSPSTNRFVTEFERYGRVSNEYMNIGLALGVLRSARKEYTLGLAIDYHLSVASAIFGSLLDQARYLAEKGYLRAAAVLAGAALEEGLRSRVQTLDLPSGARATLIPLVHQLKHADVRELTEFEARKLEAFAKIRNDAAHGQDFSYRSDQIREMLDGVEKCLARLLSQR